MPSGGLRATTFKSGQSGNPGGRPKRPADAEAHQVIADVRAAARSHTARGNPNAQTNAIEKAPWATRVAAANAVLDRGWGKPSQAVELAGAVAMEKGTRLDISRLSDSELDALERALG